MRASALLEAVAVIRERRINSRLQNLQQGLLDQPIGHRRYPQVRTRFFTAQPPDLRHRPLTTRASQSLACSTWLAAPRIRFLFIGSRFRYSLPPPRLVTLTQLRFTSLAAVSSWEDFHLQDYAYAGRIRKRPSAIADDFDLKYTARLVKQRPGIRPGNCCK